MGYQSALLRSTMGLNILGVQCVRILFMYNIVGDYVTLEPVTAYKHTNDLYRNLNYPHLWEFFHSQPYKDYQDFKQYVRNLELAADRSLENYAICSAKSGQALGFIGLDLRKLEDLGIIEIVNVMYSPKLQKTTMGTEAVYQLLRHSFELFSCDQVDWYCDIGNKNSFNAALRYGFYYNGRECSCYGGTFESFYITKPEWAEAVKNEYLRWLSPRNFDRDGRQLTKLQLKSE